MGVNKRGTNTEFTIREEDKPFGSLSKIIFFYDY